MTGDIPLFEIPWNVHDIQNVIDSIGRGRHWAKGPYIKEFEERVEKYLGVNHAVAVNSGTSALMAALVGTGIGEGDQVIIPSFTQQATANSVRLVGAKPIFADIEIETYGLDPESVRAAITEETTAIMPVHVYGSVCKIRELREIADSNNLVLIEDAAEALGAERDRAKAGTFGDCAALSFCQNKIVPTGEGGMVVTNDQRIAEKVVLYRSHGRTPADYFENPKSGEHVTVGGNFRMPDIVAALGSSQLSRVEELIQGRRRAAARMNASFESVESVTPHTFDGRHVYQFYTVTFDSSVHRDGVIDSLSERGISSKVYWDPPVHQSTAYENAERNQELPVTEEISTRVLSLPIHPELSSEETDRIAEGVQAAIAEP